MVFSRTLRSLLDLRCACAVLFAAYLPLAGGFQVSAAAADLLSVAAVLKDETALAGAHDIQVREGVAYVAGKGGSLAIVDMRQPATPRIVWSVRDAAEYEDAETVLPLADGKLLVGTRDVLLFDVNLPAKPTVLAKLHDRSRIDRINGFARRGDIVFGANKSGHAIAVDVSQPNALSLHGSRDLRTLDGFESPHDAALCGDLLVIVAPEGFGRGSRPGKLGVYRVFDAETRAVLPSGEWKFVGQLEHPRLAGANRVRVRGSVACIACSLSVNSGRNDDFRSTVATVDLTDPSQPRLLASVDFPDPRGPNGLELVGTALFAAGGQTVLALDVADPAAPRELARLTAPQAFPGAADDAHDLVYHDGHLLVTAQTSNSLVVLRAEGEGIRQAASR